MPYTNPEDQKAAARRYYEANRAKMKARALEHARKTRAEVRALVHEAKNRPCADCGIQYPYYVMQFDHLGDKAFTIASSVSRLTPAKILAEISKCEVVCANCHAERTYRRSAYGI